MSEVSFSLLDDASAAAGSGLVAGRGAERVETMISTLSAVLKKEIELSQHELDFHADFFCPWTNLRYDSYE